MTDHPVTAYAPEHFRIHPVRGAINAAFFALMGPYIDWSVGKLKARMFADLPETVVEIGSGVGANLRYLRQASTLVAIEPNAPMHGRLRAAADRYGVRLDLRSETAERTGMPGESTDCVISSLVLCTVPEPMAALVEIRRILRPGGTFRFVEHVAGRPRSLTRLLQRTFGRPWA